MLQDNRTALHIACRHGKEDIVMELIKAKANVNAQTKASLSEVLVIPQQTGSSVRMYKNSLPMFASEIL